MNKLFGFLLLCSVMVTAQVEAKTKPDETKGTFEVLPLAEIGNPSTRGIVYALPKTELEIQILAERTQYIRGPFYQYSERYLGLKDVITENEVQWDMVQVSVHPFGIPDAENHFLIRYSGNVAAPYVVKSANGCIEAVNYFKADAHEEMIKEIELQAHVATFDFVPYTEEMLVANSTAKKAEEAAAYIARIRENRTLLLSGEASHAPADGKAMELALSKLDNLEQQFLELFKGKVIHSVEEKQVHFLPTQETNRELLFRFSKYKGMVAKDDFSGEPVFLNIAITDSVTISDTPLQPERDKKGTIIKPVASAGLFYRIPGTAQVNLTYGNQSMYTGRVQIAQFGKIFSLPATVLSDPAQGVIFHPETGAIKAIVKQ